MRHTYLSTQDLRALLREECDKAGSVYAWAKKTSLSPRYVGQVLRGNALPGRGITDALGYRRVTIYVKNYPGRFRKRLTACAHWAHNSRRTNTTDTPNMLTVLSETTTYLARSEAETVAARLATEDPTWKYEVRKLGRGFVIAVYDSDGVYMGNL